VPGSENAKRSRRPVLVSFSGLHLKDYMARSIDSLLTLLKKLPVRTFASSCGAGRRESAWGVVALNDPIEPMTLRNMRELGVRSLDVSCRSCHHVAMPKFGPQMVCTGCGIVGADARPNWKKHPLREALTGVQWRS
jgi:hypothetical protein